MSAPSRKQPLPPSITTELVWWWLAELRDWFGSVRRKGASRDDMRADLIVVREGLLFGGTGAGPHAAADLASRSMEAFGKNGLSRSVSLALGNGRYLKRKLADTSVPLARAQKMAELDVETQTPFRPDDVYIFFPDPSSSGEGAYYYLVRRDVLDPVVDELQRSGRRLAGLVFQEGPDIRPASAFAIAGFAPRGTATIRTARDRLFMLACIMLIAITGYNVNSALASASASVEQAIETAEPKAKDARERFKARSEFLARIEALHTERKNYVPVARLLEELSFVLPDTTYLTSVSVRQGKVKITGFSANAADLIALVESSKVFANPKFVSAVVQAPDRKAEQFDLEAEVEHAG